MKNNNRNVTDKACWMPCPDIDTEFPGLAYMCPLDELIVVKQRDALHDLIGGNTGFTIFNSKGQKVFLAVQRTQCRKFDLKIFNHYGNEVIQVKRPFTPFLNRVLVWAPPGNFVGVVKQLKSCTHSFIVKNWYGVAIYEIKALGLFNFQYKILWQNEEVGEIRNNWDIAQFLNVKRFGISFHENMHVLDKAVLLGACFLIGRLKY